MWEGGQPKVVILKNTIYSCSKKLWDALKFPSKRSPKSQLTLNIEHLIPAEGLESPAQKTCIDYRNKISNDHWKRWVKE